MPPSLTQMVARLHRPIFLIGCARAGTTLGYTILTAHRGVTSLQGESVQAFNTFHGLSHRGYRSHRLTAEDVDPFVAQYYQTIFAFTAKDCRGRPVCTIHGHPETIRFVEKTPNNTLRVSFLHAIFEDALFILLVRDGRAVVSSLIEGWNKGKLNPYSLPLPVELEGYTRPSQGWCYTLVEGWPSLIGGTIEEVCAQQYVQGYETALHDLQGVPGDQQLMVRYEDLLARPREEWEKVAAFAGLAVDDAMEEAMVNPGHQASISLPEPDKWKRKNPERIAHVLPQLTPIMERLGYDI